MKENFTQIIFVSAIAAIIFVFPGCFQSSYLTGVKLPSTDLSFENFDQNDTLSHQPGQSKAFVSAAFTIKSPPGTILFGQIARLWFLVSFPDQKALLLRC